MDGSVSGLGDAVPAADDLSASPPPRPSRALALDALRGLAVLTMVLSGIIPWGDSLPPWMYHAQEPPPTHDFNPHLPGLTWVDLVFPVFLFAMGASIPLALARRLEGGESRMKTVGRLLLRGVTLAAFAIYLQHIRPYTLQPEPDTKTWFTAITGFLLLFPMFARFPASWNRTRQAIVRGLGWAAAIGLLAILPYPAKGDLPPHFSVGRNDIILIVLANMAFFGATLWLLTRARFGARLGVLGIYLALRLSSSSDGFIHDVWNYSPVSWIFQWDYLKYLFIVIPGTVVGDAHLKWRESAVPEDGVRVTNIRRSLLAILGVLLPLLLLIGLQSRVLLPTILVAGTCCGLAVWLVSRPSNPTDTLLRSLVVWGSYWLLLGLAFEPFEGGIKKDSATLSYFFVTSGIASFLLVSLTVVAILPRSYRWLGLFADTGQNPLIGYAIMGNVLQPLLALTHMDRLLTDQLDGCNPWLGVLRGVLQTLLLALIVRLCTQRKIFLRL